MARLTAYWEPGSPMSQTYLTVETDEGAQDGPVYTAGWLLIEEARQRLNAAAAHVRSLESARG
jgi:hypothetical protein